MSQYQPNNSMILENTNHHLLKKTLCFLSGGTWTSSERLLPLLNSKTHVWHSFKWKEKKQQQQHNTNPNPTLKDIPSCSLCQLVYLPVLGRKYLKKYVANSYCDHEPKQNESIWESAGSEEREPAISWPPPIPLSLEAQFRCAYSSVFPFQPSFFWLFLSLYAC